MIEILVLGNSCYLELRQNSPVLCALENSFGVLLQPCYFMWNKGYTMLRRHAHLELVPSLPNSVQRTLSLLLRLNRIFPYSFFQEQTALHRWASLVLNCSYEVTVGERGMMNRAETWTDSSNIFLPTWKTPQEAGTRRRRVNSQRALICVLGLVVFLKLLWPKKTLTPKLEITLNFQARML